MAKSKVKVAERRQLAQPPKGARCQVRDKCDGDPAEFIVRLLDARDDDAVSMCPICANHHVARNGAMMLYDGDRYRIPEVNVDLDTVRLEKLRSYVYQGMEKFRAKIETELREIVGDRMTAAALAQVYVAARGMVEACSFAAKPIDDLVATLGDIRIPEAFEHEGIRSFTTQNDFRVTVSSRLFASIQKNSKDEALEWLRSNGLGDLIQETVNAGTLSAQGKLMLEQGHELPEELFNTAYKTTTSLTKVPKKGNS